MKRFNPFLIIFNNPFDKEFLLSLPQALFNSIMLYTLKHSIVSLEPTPKAFELLQDQVSQKNPPPLLRHLLSEQLILANRTHETWSLFEENPSVAIVIATRAWLHFIEGRDAEALADYSAAHKQLRKTSGKRKVYFNDLPGVFYVMGLLHEGSAKSLKQALEIVSIVENIPEHAYPKTYHALKTLILLQQGVIKHPGILFSKERKAAELAHSDGILFLLVAYWLDAIDKARLKFITNELLIAAQNSGYQWFTDELQALLAKLGQGERPSSQNRRYLVDLIKRKAPWEHALDALTTIAGGGPAKPNRTNQSRLVWLLDYYGSGYCDLEPREQKQDKSGKWTKGRPYRVKTAL